MKNKLMPFALVLLFGLVISVSSCDTRNDFPEDSIADAPVVSISLEEDSLRLLDTLKITLEATSEVGLAMIWWYAEREDLGVLSNVHAYYCDSTHYERITWQVVMDTVLNFRIGADARDVLYGNGLPHQASDIHPVPYKWVYVEP